MKYIKLYEALESDKLSKTIGFIKEKEDRKRFLEDIKKVCNQIDYPYSKLSDDNFQYLPYKAALNVNAIVTDIPCDATSERAFPEYPVAGEVCNGGKIVRMWGTRRREVVCPICNGTGVKKTKPEIKWIKFWFSAEGKYIATTAVDGQIRKGSKRHVGGQSYIGTLNLSDYNEGNVVSLRDLRDGDVALVSINRELTVCYIIKEYEKTYAIQDRHSGSSPDNTPRTVWQQYGSRSWALVSSGDYEGQIKLLLPKGKSEEIPVENEPDPITWNVFISLSRYGFDISSKDVEDAIKDAHFAIVMDFGKIKASGFKTKSLIKGEREESREGASALMSDDDIRKENLKRYIDKISKSVDLSNGFSDITKILPRIFGGRLALVYTFRARNFDDFNYIIDDIFKFMKSTTDSDKLRWANEATGTLNDVYKSNISNNKRYNNHLEFTRKEIERNNKSEYGKLLDKLMELSSKINTSILQKPVESLEDLELAYRKMKTLRDILRSDRYLIRRLDYFFERFTSDSTDRTYRYLVEYVDESDIDRYINDIDSLIKIVEKL
jgi:hypothetical protein